MSTVDSIKAPVKAEMEEFQHYFKSYLKSKATLLNIIINYLLKQKGKQMRPLLIFLTARLNGEINESTYHAASMIELMHTASLVHDDVVDDSNMRRGFLSINALWKNKIAVLLGDYLLAKGMLLAVHKEEFELLKIVSKAVEEMSEGELIQIEKARKLDIDEATYFEIIRKKTAALMVACTSAGTYSVGVNGSSLEKMREFGEYLGMAFQIRDDLFDFDRSGIFGKPSGNDIKERKMTLPFIHALNQCSSSEKNHIIRLMRKKNKSTQMVDEIMDFVKNHGGIEYARSVMDAYKQKALQILTLFPQNDANLSLVQLVEYTTERKK
ncbi:MAG TPA: polyprenyl synthetase [Marinilabiliales bacterium]|jgi:octaprenyl-diphosphate synthase|nr:MAG: polyprenyl synthetase [Bacteroidetes bacterium GWA2_40_14]OFX59058.1 MAG: polyprenyl synthetase [Bacteroidetes bacterium GWC2_40_13]OFX72229.1 MAG: polyprenyl synthetase [Bacteroidetes bacterium GWD2_40_43]OFX90525.1 MAG: polyprenyl synthetase [Bacteroidetes bacterium GWE2_40_63]OFY17231.1 MAG: polyprenyl synthetase [Bacteroidetes bacterium GWF2_40_13]OFZ26514.1 MAG: polyprenyl synthetase [Bacteroidetes bacterium RIFOXYC2_FULL_40_12]HAN00787.1 polyprenyl synthetase [Marinilabiliales b